MDIKQLRSFVAVVDCGSFTRAAERLSISQPSVSAHVHQLEDELRERLFLRTTKSLAITPRGRELYEYAAHVLALQDRLFARWAEDATMIRLAASTIPSTYILPELLPRYRALQPDVTFRKRFVKIENGKVTNYFQFRNSPLSHHHALTASSCPLRCPCFPC